MLFNNNDNIRRSTRLFSLVILAVTFAINAGVVFAAAFLQEDEENVAVLNTQYQVVRATDDYIVETQIEEFDEPEETNIPEIVEVDEMHTEEYIVQAGDSLWRIAEIAYGDGSMYGSLMELNGIEDEDSIYVGQVIKYYTEEITIEAACIQYSSLKAEQKKQQSQVVQNQNTTSGSAESGAARNYRVPSAENMTYEGQFFITGYDPWCAHCCGKSNAITASGAKATAGKTIATSKKYPFGTKLYIEGYGIYTVEDRGVSGNVIDIAAESHEACRWLTQHNVNVYIVNE